jgi:uncharacterized protein YukE
MSGGGLRVDPDGVRAAAARAAGAATGGPSTLTVAPCAADAASHAAAWRLGTRAMAVLAATATLDEATAAAGVRLSANAETYVAQDITGAAGLRSGVGLGSAPTESVAVVSPRVVPPVAAASAGGVRPVTGKQAAELIHGGSSAGMLAAAEVLDGHSARCEEAAADLRAARGQALDSWSSAAADEADARLSELADGYAGQGRAARELAAEIRSQADDFIRTRDRIPAPKVFDDLEARIAAAVAANSHPGSLGTLTSPIHVLQAKLAAAHHDGLTGYAGYQADSDLTADGGSPSGPAAAQGDSGSTDDGPGSSPSGVGDAAANPLVGGGLPAPMDEMLQSVLPAVLGGVLGAAGGAVGALSGAAQQLQQVGTGLASGLTQGASGMLAADTPRGDPSRTGRGSVGYGGGDDPVVSAGNGPQPGDTEPASAPGALTAPFAPAAMAAPAAASPAAFSAAVTPASLVPTPAGAAMLPPMMTMAGAGSSAAEDDQRLYGPRRLRVEAPPNTEPVKGRREARRGRAAEAGGD